jgi:hypothetical protein
MMSSGAKTPKQMNNERRGKGAPIASFTALSVLKPYNHFDEYYSLLLNAIKITKKDDSLIVKSVENFIKKIITTDGIVGYDGVSNKWRKVILSGTLNDLDLEKSATFLIQNNGRYMKSLTYEESDGTKYYVIPSTENRLSFYELIKATTDFMYLCDEAINQNIESSKRAKIVVCRDENTRLSLQHAIVQNQSGQAVVMVSEGLADGLKGIDIDVNLFAGNLVEIRDQARDNLFNKLGILTANTNKRERVQATEVNATAGVASDYIYMLIDCFNSYCKTYGIDAKMNYNGSMEEMYLNKKNQGDDIVSDDMNENLGGQIND